MSAFGQLRDELSEARAAEAKAADELAAARARAASADAELARARRTGADVEALEHAQAEATAQVETATDSAAKLRAAALTALGSFAAESDPRQQAVQLTPGVPLLLFPLRLETRYKRVRLATGLMQDQLWVRVFPDTCLVDTFEPVPSAIEIESTRRYWAAVWRAGGAEDGERAAWRNLVASHGAGRARWLVENLAPANPGDKPPPPAAGTVLLVAAADDALDRSVLAAYWEAEWRGDPDALKLLADKLGIELERAEAIRIATRPAGFDEPPAEDHTRADTPLSVAVASFAPVTDAPLPSWTRAPHVDALPDRLLCIVDGGTAGRIEVLGEMIATPLHVGPDPSGPPQLKPDGADIAVADELRWMVDFGRAVKDGLGFRIALDPDLAAKGADHVTVVGLRLAEDADRGAQRLEELLAHHRDGRSGLELIRQGTPTNNTEAAGAGFTRGEDADAAFDLLSDRELPDDAPADRLDGRWLTAWLGIDPTVVARVPGAFGTDQLEARAMNVALWPATLGYFLETLMDPIVSANGVDDTRWFFTNFVSGRGALPVVRIGSQPYGILPAVAFGRLTPQEAEEGRADFLRRLLAMLKAADTDWATYAAQVRSLGRPGSDIDADLLDVLGLHAASAEFHYRYAEGLDHLINVGGLFGFAQQLLQILLAAALDAPALALLQRLGAPASERPDILDKYFMSAQGGLLGNVVDDRPLSESEPIRDWTTDGRNYIDWLAVAARKSLETVRAQQGFIDGKPPTALLYLLLRHALLLSFHDAAYQLHRSKISDAALHAMKREPAFVHVAGTPSESRWAPLVKTDATITGDPTRTVAEYLIRNFGRISETAQLVTHVRALRRLASLPTARLERLMAEHIDTCSYRFDAWRLGYVHHHIERLRAKNPHGIHLGAYGRLEDVRPSGVVRSPAKLPADLRAIFQRRGDAPLEVDPTNGGFIHAPSLDQAVTAAVLRAGHVAHAGTETLAVNLSSERVRLALSTVEGIRNGQTLGALLGYRFERELHDHGGIVEVDRFILPLRKAFPLLADRLASTKTADDVPAEHAAARNVLDGLALVEHVDAQPGGYPFGKALPAATDAERAVIDAAVERLRDLHDAIGDLALAEGVHQAAQGRYDAAAAFLDSVGTGAHPPDPDVVRTPRRGVTLTHRLALQFDPNTTAAAGATPRAIAEPRVDRWLEEVLPVLDDVACHVVWDGGDAEVSLADLALRPLDVLACVHAEGHAMTELDDRILAHVLANNAVPLTARPEIRYLDAVPGRLRVFDVIALVRTLRTLLGRSRPLRASDAALPTEAASVAEGDVQVERARIADPLTALEALRDDLDAHAATLDGSPADVDAAIADTAALLARAAAFGVPQTGWGFAYAWRREQVAALVARVGERVAAWDARLQDFDDLLVEFDALPAALQTDEKLSRLRRAEMCVAATVSAETDLAALRAALPAQRSTFAARRAALAGSIAPTATYQALVGAVQDVLPLTDVDLEPFDLTPEAERIAAFVRELSMVVGAVAADVRSRATSAAAALAAADAALSASDRVAALTAAAKAMFGDDALVVPDAGVPSAQAAEWANALAASRGGTLTSHLHSTGVELPVDEWLTGVARVRDQARAFEQAAISASGFGRAELELTPVQLPYLDGDHWLALPFPDDAVLNQDRLLFTAWVPPGFDPAARLCGLLLDEWTEVLPGTSQETGIATHYDRPNSEPPQALLLASPTAPNGAWTWADVTDAVDDTFALARKRAVEPVHLDATPYARVLPATVSSTTLRGISIGLAFAVNNAVSQFAQEAIGG
jgi:hypothetical protein